MYQIKIQRGFTLIELLVVIAIIGILASVVLASLKDARLSAQYTVAQQEMNLIRNAFLVAGRSSEPIISITGDNCTACSCRADYGAPEIIANLPTNHVCRTDWVNSLHVIGGNSVYLKEAEGLYLDPWGAPYLLDENEFEFPDDLCRIDRISTAGADSIPSTADDFVIRLPFRTQECKS